MQAWKACPHSSDRGHIDMVNADRCPTLKVMSHNCHPYSIVNPPLSHGHCNGIRSQSNAGVHIYSSRMRTAEALWLWCRVGTVVAAKSYSELKLCALEPSVGGGGFVLVWLPTSSSAAGVMSKSWASKNLSLAAQGDMRSIDILRVAWAPEVWAKASAPDVGVVAV